MKHENKCKSKGIMVLPALGEENLAKRSEENDKILMRSLVRVEEREREKFEKLLKSEFEQVKIRSFKNLIHNFQLIEILGSIDRNRQRLT